MHVNVNNRSTNLLGKLEISYVKFEIAHSVKNSLYRFWEEHLPIKSIYFEAYTRGRLWGFVREWFVLSKAKVIMIKDGRHSKENDFQCHNSRLKRINNAHP